MLHAMKTHVVILVATVAVVLTSAGADKSPAQFYCGRRLAMTIALMCASEGEEAKRSYSPMLGYERSYNSIPGYESGFAWPWLTQHRAKEMGARGKRVMMGVADECCVKPCTEEELHSYC